MNIKNWLIEDSKYNLWRFHIKDNGELAYNISYEDNKWTKDMRIDRDVLEFSVKIDEKDNIHIIYYCKRRELRYYHWDGVNWNGQILYSFDDRRYILGELNFVIIENKFHIFFLFKNSEINGSGMLMHYVWDSIENHTHTIGTINTIASVKKHYNIEVIAESIIHLFYIGDEFGEAVVRNCFYQDESWSKPKKLYGINGDKIDYCSLERDNEFHLLNISRENLVFSVEHVWIDFNGKLNNYKIYESNVELKNCMLFINENMLWALWAQKDVIFYASFDKEWSAPKKLKADLKSDMGIYIYKSNVKEKENIKIRELFVTQIPYMSFFIPNSKDKGFVKNEDRPLKGDKADEEKDDVETILDELARKNELNKSLQKRIASLQLQIIQHNRKIEELDEKYNLLLQQKIDTEEKYISSVKINEKLYKELEETKKLISSND